MINLKELEQQLDETLGKETYQSLNDWFSYYNVPSKFESPATSMEIEILLSKLISTTIPKFYFYADANDLKAKNINLSSDLGESQFSELLAA